MRRLSVFLLLGFALATPAQDLPLDLTGYRSLSMAAQRLRERTGWLLSVEEPVWPAKAAASPGREKGIRGTEPPAPDRLRVVFGFAHKAEDRANAAQQVTAAFNAQNTTAQYAALRAGEYSVLAANGSLLARTVTVAAVRRSPEKHLGALAAALTQVSGVAVDIDTAAFGFQFNAAYLGAGNGIETPPLRSWGASGQVARQALAAFLSKSMTSTVWQLNCQVGIQPAKGYCVLSVMPLVVETKTARGRMVKRTLMYDRGVGPKGLPRPPLPPDE